MSHSLHDLTRGAWTLASQPAAADTRRWAVRCEGASCSSQAWLESLRDDAELRAVLTEALRTAPFAGYFWETAPVVAGATDGGELVLVASDALARTRADASAFAGAFRAGTDSIATFGNLGGDAVLVAPHPRQAPGAGHLAAFVRGAPDAIVDALWTSVGSAVAQWVATRALPLWVSTSGLGVPWLHVRLDSAPKYYSYRPYASRPS